VFVESFPTAPTTAVWGFGSATATVAVAANDLYVFDSLAVSQLSWPQAYGAIFIASPNVNSDDNYVPLVIPFGVRVGGTDYGAGASPNIFIGSNTYITFGAASTAFTGLGATNPLNIPTLFLGARDNSFQRVFARLDGTVPGSRYFRVLYEGTAAVSGAAGDPNIQLEVAFAESDNSITVTVGRHAASTALAGFSNGAGGLIASSPNYLQQHATYVLQGFGAGDAHDLPWPPPWTSGLAERMYDGYMADNPYFFSSSTPVTSDVVTVISHDFGYFGGSNEDGDNFSYEWLGYFYAPVAGTYSFRTDADDRSYLWLGSTALSGYATSNALVNNGGSHDAERIEASTYLEIGYYPIRVQFGESNGAASVYLLFKLPGDTDWRSDGQGYFLHNPDTLGF